MTQRTALTSLLACCVLAALPATAAPEAEDSTAQSRVLADQLTGQLEAELQQALQAGGAIAVIEVCHRRAPEIAAQLGQESGARVGRTALRVRNPANAPDDLERSVLQQFADELAAAIGSRYPEDAATGFETGELRGAVTVRWPARE